MRTLKHFDPFPCAAKFFFDESAITMQRKDRMRSTIFYDINQIIPVRMIADGQNMITPVIGFFPPCSKYFFGAIMPVIPGKNRRGQQQHIGGILKKTAS